MSNSLWPHGRILQVRILEWVAFLFSKGSSKPRDQTEVSRTEGGFFTSWATREALCLKENARYKMTQANKHSVQFSSVAQLCPTLCDPMYCSTPGLPVHHQLLEPTQTHVHCVSDAIQPSYPLLSPSPPAFNLSQHQGLFQSVGSLHQVASVLEPELHHLSFQWIFRTDLL